MRRFDARDDIAPIWYNEDVKTTLREIARHANVHQSTASYILNGTGGSTRVSEETRQRVLEVAAKLGYTANRAAQQLRTRRSMVIGMLTGDLENPFFARHVSLCTAELERLGYESVLAMRRQGEFRDFHLIQALSSRQVDGLLIWSESDSEIRTWLEQNPHVTNVVVMGYRIDPCDSVEAALEIGVWAALRHLAEQGMRRIAYVAPASALEATGDPRLGVYRHFMAESNLEARLLTYEGPSSNPASVHACMDAIAGESEAERPEALFCFNDMTALGALTALRRRGLRVPQDIALIGCDDLPLASQLDVPLTSIGYPLPELCRTAVQMLIERIEFSLEDQRDEEGNRAVLPRKYALIPTTLQIRESSVRK